MEKDDKKEEKVYLIGGKEFDKAEYGKKVACCYTYTYFIVATILAILWFIVMALENAIYRKTGTCNDINVKDSSFICFDVTSGSSNPNSINCQVGSNPDITVFCYLYSPNPGAVGIAVGIFNLFIFGITAYFRLTTKMAENEFLRVLVIVLQAVLYLFTIAVCIGLLVGHFRFKAELYFFQGNAIIRWVIFLLFPITGAALIPVPWCFFTKPPAYNSMYLCLKQDITQDNEQDNEQNNNPLQYRRMH